MSLTIYDSTGFSWAIGEVLRPRFLRDCEALRFENDLDMGVVTGLGETDLFDFVSVFFVLLILMFTDLGEGAGEYFFWTLPYFFISSNFGETPDVAVEIS